MRIRSASILLKSAGLLALLFLFASNLAAQEYAVPLEIANVQSSSNFGKLRGTRYHSGVDFRTGGVEGKKIVAIEDGYIYRIGVKPYGYGNVLYVVHPDGRISVYGHLSKFSSEVDRYVRSERYRQKKNDIDLFLSKNKFKVKKGEVIGLSGNSGSSSGPHLHFEIREAGGDRTINALARGYYPIKDNIAPQLFNVCYYTVDTLMDVPIHTLSARAKVVKGADNRYTLSEPMKLPGKGYFVVETMDRKNDVSGSMATYRITLQADGETRIEYLMDGFKFSDNHFAKVVSDYQLNRTTSNDVFRLAVVNSGATPFYRKVVEQGVIDPAAVDSIRIEVEDDNKNSVEVSFPVVYDPTLYLPTVAIATDAEPVDFRKNYARTTDSLKVTIPAGTLYESLFYKQGRAKKTPTVKKSEGTRILSGFYDVHANEVPLRSAVTLSFKADVPVELREKVVVARVTDNGRLAASSAKYVDGTVTGKASLFGVWCVAADTTPPQITSSFKSGADLSGARSVNFKISDDFSGVASYSVSVDGAWVLLEHDTVHGKIYHYFDDELSGREKTHAIEVIVRDGVGNQTRFYDTYYR